jgi:hypothetical protein
MMTKVQVEYCHAALAWNKLDEVAKSDVSLFYHGVKKKIGLCDEALSFVIEFPHNHAYGNILYERFDPWTRLRLWLFRKRTNRIAN